MHYKVTVTVLVVKLCWTVRTPVEVVRAIVPVDKVTLVGSSWHKTGSSNQLHCDGLLEMIAHTEGQGKM